MRTDLEPMPQPPQAPARRRLTLLYTDLSGSTVLSAAAEPEHYRALLQSLRQVWHAVAKLHHGQVVLTQGDGALLAFGLPLVGEQDGRHAADAALAVHAMVAALQPPGVPAQLLPLRMHSAIHAGNLLLDEGDIEHGVFDLSGDVLNTTAHLARQAQPGQVLATLPALGPNAAFFTLGDAPPEGVALLNPALSSQVRVVLGRGQATRRFDATAQRGLTPFIGRAAVLASLQAFLHRPGSTPQRCLVLQGAAGLGKTRLLEQLLDATDLAGYRVLRGSCENDLGAEVLQPFVQMLRGWVLQQAAAGVGAPPLSPALADSAAAVRSLVDSRSPLSAALDSASGVVGLLQRFFTALADGGARCVLVIDDWQWADDASRQLLQALSAQPQGPALLLASRPREAAVDWVAGAPHLTVDAFTPEETAVAVQRLLARPDPFLVARIHDYAGGVPLFIEELCHTVSADQLPHAIDGRGAAQSWLATLVVGRLERLPPDQAEVVRAAAVVGNVVPLRWLAVACGQAPDPLLLQALVAADFLRADLQGEVLRFKHGITRDAVYDSIGLQQRMALHQRMQAALVAEASADGTSESLEALAYHGQGAGDWENTARYAEQAGDKAFAAFAVDRARAHYQGAMNALDRLPTLAREDSIRWCQVANKLGLASVFDPVSLGNDVSAFERSVALAQASGDAGLLARTEYWLGYICYTLGRLREGMAHCRQALQRARGLGDHRLAVQIEATLGQFLVAASQYDDAMALMDAALNTKQRRKRVGGGVAIGSAYTLACKASVLADQGAFTDAWRCLDESLILLGESTHPVANSVRNWVVITLIWQGRFAEAERVCKACIRNAETTQALFLLTVCRALWGYVRWRDTADRAALVAMDDAVRWMEARGGQFYSSLYQGWLSEGWVAEGDIAKARHHAARTLARVAEGERLGEAVACRAMAAVARQRGRQHLAALWLRRAERSAGLRQSPREAALNQLCAAHLACADGRTAVAAQLAEQAQQTFAELQMHHQARQALDGPWRAVV